MTTAELPLLEIIAKCSPSAKTAILAALLRERLEERVDADPFFINDEEGKSMGTFVPGFYGKRVRRTSPPSLTPEERAELQRRYENRENSLSFEEMVKSLDLDAPAPGSGS